MEEEKAAAYYDELTRKGGGAARFKQGLGFSTNATTTSDAPPSRGSALPGSTSSSTFLSSFVRASSPTKAQEIEKKAQLHNIQNKLKKKESTSIDTPNSEKIRVRVRVRDKERRSPKRRSRSRSRSDSESDGGRERSRRRHYRSSSRERRRDRVREKRRNDRDRDSDRDRRRRRSRSRSSSDGERRHGRDKERYRSLSPRDQRLKKGRENGGKERRVVMTEGNGSVDYARLIDGYDKMSPAERVKARMKIQLSQTAEKDVKMGTGSGWERFDFNKDAPVDDEEIEAADDDVAVVKRIGQSFRFTSLEAKREDEVRNAHDEAMFGVPAPAPSHTSESEEAGENEPEETNHNDLASSLLNEKVLGKQQSSWRDRARRNVG